ncbi:MAG: amidase [Acetobacteraceae bacterium]|jgi:amidase|nr:amidase [Acetobacteraceae bacterium]
MPDIAFASARALARLVRSGKVGARELLDHYLARAGAYDGSLNAIVVRDITRARKDAARIDRARAKGDALPPLAGVPMTVKESFNLAGLPTTWGDPAFAGTVAAEDALAVSRFREAGAVIFGKTNVPLMLADWQSYNAVYGTTNNPWDVTRVPGGSSGGSAVALAAGMTGLEIGSDIGASIRNPAHYCGVFGHKPTWGICSPKGHTLGTVAPSDISAIGPLARSAGDLALALDIMAGPDEIDGAGWALSLPKPRLAGLKGLRVAVVAEDANAEVDHRYSALLADLARSLRKEGAKVSLTARPGFDTAEMARLYILLLRAATSARLTDAAVARWEAEAAARGPEDASYVALMARGNTLSHRDWLRLNEARHVMRHAWAAFFKEWDVVLTPVASGPAFPHDQAGERHERTIMVNGHAQPVTDQLFWAGYPGLFYLPATVAPLGLIDGLPVGVQIIGAQYADRTTIRVAQLLEKTWRGFVPPPGYEG